jgi:hypothetical protein
MSLANPQKCSWSTRGVDRGTARGGEGSMR